MLCIRICERIDIFLIEYEKSLIFMPIAIFNGDAEGRRYLEQDRLVGCDMKEL
jgi:hypothetical protein